MNIPEHEFGQYHISLAGVGVLIFFAISGFLNTESIFQRRSVLPFLLSRAVRIYPALIVCVAFTVILGAIATPSLSMYFNSELLAFVGKNITLLTGVKVGLSQAVFAGSTLPDALNGSLWTLPYEVRMYVLLALCLAALRYSPIVALVVATFGILVIGFSPLQAIWLQFTAMFLAGSFVAVIARFTNLLAAIFALAFLSITFFVLGKDLFASYLLLVASIVAIGATPAPRWLRPPLDLSYAIYLYAFPLQQLSVMTTNNFWNALALSGVGTVLLAVLSVVFVEQPAQRLNSAWQRRISPPPTLAIDNPSSSPEQILPAITTWPLNRRTMQPRENTQSFSR